MNGRDDASAPRVLITGAAGGVGLACAEAFAARGAALILCDHDGTALTRVNQRLIAFTRFCDAISDSAVAVFAAELADSFPAIDVLINAAGHGYVRSLAMARMTRAMMPLLRRADGQRLVVNMAPAGGFRKANEIFPYASSEHAFDRLSAALAEQARGTAIDIVSMKPSIALAAKPRSSGVPALYEFQRVDEATTARRIVEMVSVRRPEWQQQARQAGRRA